MQEVLVELNRQNQAKQDFISPAQGMRLREDGQTFEINHLTTSQQEVFGTTSLFHRQVASALGIPAKYYDLMQAQKPELLAENVNSWFADKPSSYMVRSMDYGAGQVARALLSERYRCIDNMEIATAVLPLFAGNDQYEVMSCEVTENRLYLKVVNHRLEMEVRKGDIVQAGVMISNSEVGLGAVSIQPLVYRLVCTNGMGERRHHVGRQTKAVEDSFALYSDETMEAEDKAFLLKLRDTTMATIDEARFSQVVGRLQESMAVPITGRVQDVVQLTAQSYGINAGQEALGSDPIKNFAIADQKPCCSSEELRLKVKKMQRMFTKQIQSGIKAKDSSLCFRICTETCYNCQWQKNRIRKIVSTYG